MSSDHQDYCNILTHENIAITQDIGNLYDDSENVIIEEKYGDDFLIELYRERSFLYDKSNPNFKDTLMKQNAWNEISKTMIETNCGDLYTPDYCQKRCTSLRDQYNREKKKIESQFKSGSAASNSRQFPFYSQLTFLDKVIKRRRTYSNVTKSQASATLNKKSKICEVDNGPSSDTENQNTNNEQTTERTCSSKVKRRKMDETKQLEQTFLNTSNRIVNYMETMDSSSTADQAFMEFIKVQFASIPKNEKNVRRKLIMDAISTPLP